MYKARLKLFKKQQKQLNLQKKEGAFNESQSQRNTPRASASHNLALVHPAKKKRIASSAKNIRHQFGERLGSVGKFSGSKRFFSANSREEHEAIEEAIKKAATEPSQYDLLYQDAMARALRHKRLREAFTPADCTFEPKLVAKSANEPCRT